MIIELENLNDKPIKYHLNVKGGNAEVYINSEGNTYIGNNNNQIQFDGDKVFIGSRLYAGKAKEVGINAERVILGNSTFYNPKLGEKESEVDFPIYEYTEASDFPSSLADKQNPPQHQWAVMGETLVYLIAKLIEIWKNTKYQGGSTICTVSEIDKISMYEDVYAKLPLILSQNVSLVNKPGDPSTNT